VVGPGGAVRPARRILDAVYAISTRDASTRQLTTGHCPAVPTRASQSDSRRCARTRRPAPPTLTTMTTNKINNKKSQRPLDTCVHLRPSGAPDGRAQSWLHPRGQLECCPGRACLRCSTARRVRAEKCSTRRSAMPRPLPCGHGRCSTPSGNPTTLRRLTKTLGGLGPARSRSRLRCWCVSASAR
jgi:hypothetical protein